MFFLSSLRVGFAYCIIFLAVEFAQLRVGVWWLGTCMKNNIPGLHVVVI